MGGFSAGGILDSTSTSNDNRIAATDAGKILGKSALLTESGSFAITGKGSSLNETGSVNNAGAKNLQFGGIQVGKKGTLTVNEYTTISDNTVLADALNQNAASTSQALRDSNSSLGNTFSSALTSLGSSLSSGFDSLKNLFSSTPTSSTTSTPPSSTTPPASTPIGTTVPDTTAVPTMAGTTDGTTDEAETKKKIFIWIGVAIAAVILLRIFRKGK